MIGVLEIFFLCCILNPTHEINVQIDGLIDLGPNWSYMYKIKPFKDSRIDNDNNKLIVKKHHKDKNGGKSSSENIKENYKEISDVKDTYTDKNKEQKDDVINDFIKHIFKQTLQVFENLKSIVSGHEVRKKIDFLAQNYESKFKEFVEDTQRQKIKTRLGTQKVIFNTIDTSNSILNRLVNYLISDIDHRGLLRSNIASTNVIQKEVNNEIQEEYRLACTKYGICRTGKTFIDFLIELITILISCDDPKLKQAVDSLTEVAKNTKTPALDYDNHRLFLKLLDRLERVDARSLRAGLKIIKNVLIFRNKPIHVKEKNVSDNEHKFINRTIAFLDVINFIDNKSPGNSQSLLEWTSLKESLSLWIDGKESNLEDVVNNFVNVVNRSLEKLTEEEFSEFNKNVNIMLE